jgi:hypothetical protein
LKTETNSDSPSEKSKRLQLVSAKQEINHTKDNENVKKLTKYNTENSKNPTNYNHKLKKQMTTKLKTNLPHKK